MIKFNLREEKIKLSKIMSYKPKVENITPEKLKQSIINNLPTANNSDTQDFMKHLGIEKLNTPEAGLKAKMNYWKEKDNSVQERIIYAQSWNLAVQVVSTAYNDMKMKTNKYQYGQLAENYKYELENWQQYFYKKLKENN